MELSKENVKTGLTSNAIKIIAIIAMTIDHIAWTFFPHYSLDVPIISMKIIGRLTAPIMMFFIAEGYYHTKNIKKYIFRLFVFAIISHFAYAIAFDKNFVPFKNSVFDQTSIIWALMLGLIALAIRESKSLKIKMWQKHIIIFIIICTAFPADWSSPAALAVLYMGMNHGNFKRQMVSLVVCITLYSIIYAIFLNVVYGILQMLIVLAIPILYQYNGQR
ncbi:MAG: conjugal transfer protein TraX, partial [Spirochaetaceae bacterium]|nr:conjugal transfer protein TraX [Spirochaetaceae bacterium]